MRIPRAEIAGVGVLTIAAAINWWAVPYFTGQQYLNWYLGAGPFVALAIAVISVAWGELDKNTGLISRNPLRYSAASLHAASLPLLAIGGHARRQNQPNRLPLLDSISYIVVMLLIAGAVVAWLWLVSPLQYFVTLVCGAPARASRSSTYVLYAKVEDGKLAIEEGKLGDDAPAGYWDASMRDKPLALVSALSAGLLFVIGVVAS